MPAGLVAGAACNDCTAHLFQVMRPRPQNHLLVFGTVYLVRNERKVVMNFAADNAHILQYLFRREVGKIMTVLNRINMIISCSMCVVVIRQFASA